MSIIAWGYGPLTGSGTVFEPGSVIFTDVREAVLEIQDLIAEIEQPEEIVAQIQEQELVAEIEDTEIEAVLEDNDNIVANLEY
jgi:hypothetical protein